MMARAWRLAVSAACLIAIPAGADTAPIVQPVGQAHVGRAWAAGAAADSAARAKPAKGQLRYLDPAAFVPERLVPPPPAVGSRAEALELLRLHRLIASTSPQRLARARWDGDHEDPSAFDAVTGRDLRALPATWALLTIIQQETDAVIDRAKVHFNRPRPWGVDPSVPHCDRGKGKKPVHSYPSGHSGLAYSVGWALAQLIPGSAPQILARADDYALSREICGVHFHSDTEASHVIGTLAAATLFADPRLSRLIAQARGELSRH